MQKLKQKRIDSKLTMNELGNLIGLAGKTIYQYEADKRKPNYQVLKKIATVFNCSVDELID